IPKYRELVNQVHENGTKIAMQIAHAGRQTTQEAIGTQPIAPSAVKDKSIFVTPREMKEEDIERVIEAFAQAARRVKESGFDAVQFHGAHGFLISQFLCPHTNRREDRWGGPMENRILFVREIYNRCREQVGADYPILIKISAYDNMKTGLKLDEGVVMAEMMAQMGFDGIEVSCGIGEDGGSTVRGEIPFDVVLDQWEMYKKKNPLFKFIMRRYGSKIMKPLPFIEGYNRESARLIKSKVNVPIFLVGGMTRPEIMEEVIERGDADYTSLCRALIADANFPNKIRQGSRESSRCVHCNLCLFYSATQPVRCYRGKRISSNGS
ncbi:MAG: NADH:flavin oxidoreductase, partial [Proteobacteria bacterium]|nr:NADH:flavin oxidoreductase [Pseudomonadota bacterium]